MASSYRFDVKEDGTFENRKTFAFVNSGVPDGRNPLTHHHSLQHLCQWRSQLT